MADAQNPNQGSPGQGGPARSAPGNVDPASAAAILDAFNRLIPSIKVVVEQVDKIVEKMEKVGKVTEEENKKIRSMGSELRQAMQYADSMEDTFKHLLDYQKKMAKEGLQAKNYEDVLKLFREMEKESKKLLDDGVFSKKHTRLLQQNTESIKKKIADLQKELGKAFDPHVADKMLSEFQKLSKEALDLGKNIKNVRMKGLQADLEGARKSMLHLFQRPDRQQKYKDFAKTASGIKEAREHRDAGRHKEFQKKREDLEKHLPKLVSRYGKNATPEEKSKMAQEYLSAKARKGGMGRIGSAIMGRSASDKIQGKQSGVLTRAGMAVLARGEGSFGSGIARMGVGALEGGAAGIAELAGPLAGVLAGLEVLKGMFNKNQEMNAQAAEGDNGIFSGGGTAEQNITAVRGNLTPTMGSMLQYGMGYDKNIAIRKSLSDAGLSTANLANTQLGQDKEGFTNGSMGQMQRNVYQYGKAAGLDSSQTVAETIKLVSQYKQSLEATHDFFIRINKEAATAGITVSKYIQVMDDVNSHYEKSNKLLETTVETMRLLSVTGMNTAEDISDSMNALTNHGQKNDLATSGYLYTQIMNSPTDKANIQKNADAALDTALAGMKKVMGDAFDPDEWKKKFQKTPGDAYNELRSQIKRKFANDPTQLNSAQGVNRGLLAAGIRSQGTADATHQGGSKGAMMLASMDNMTGGTVYSQMFKTITAMENTLKKGTGGKFDMNDFLKNPAAVNALPGVGELYKSFGGKPEDLEKLPEIASDAAAGRMSYLQKASDTDLQDPKSQAHAILEATAGFLKGKVDLGPGDQAENLRKIIKGTDTGSQDKVMGALGTSADAFKDAMMNPQLMQALATTISAADEKATKDKMAGANSLTRSTAEIWKDAFTILFTKLQTPLDKISDVVEFIGKHIGYRDPSDVPTESSAVMAAKVAQSTGMAGGGAMVAAAQAAQAMGIGGGESKGALAQEFAGRMKNQRVDSALKSYENQITDLEGQPQSGDVPDLLAKARKAHDELQRISAAYEDDKQRGSMSAADDRTGKTLTDNSPYAYRPILDQKGIQDLFKNDLNIGSGALDPGKSINVSNAQWDALNGQITDLPDAYQKADVKDAQGKVTGHTITNITNNSVAYNTSQDAKNSVQQTGETAKQPPNVSPTGNQ